MELIEVPGKWVFAGEHSVLRGGNALVFPYPQVKLQLRWDTQEGDVEPASLTPWLKELATTYLSGATVGQVRVESTIPSGSGLGSSAALSVAVARWLRARGAQIDDLFACARELESRFHGSSSGMDVAAVLSQGPLLFCRGKPPRALEGRAPHVTLHDTGLRASTRSCIDQLDRWREAHATEASELDAQMSQAVEFGMQGLALQATEPDQANEYFARGFRLSFEVFRKWGLVPRKVESQAQKLLKQGALAVRLTGAGMGGTLAALWKNS